MRAAVTATVATLMAVTSVPNGAGAHASSDSIALNGTYTRPLTGHKRKRTTRFTMKPPSPAPGQSTQPATTP